MDFQPKGIIPAMVTPVTSGGKINLPEETTLQEKSRFCTRTGHSEFLSFLFVVRQFALVILPHLGCD